MAKFVKATDVKDLLNGLDSLPWEDEVEDLVNELATADVAEVKHGEWVLDFTSIYELDECHCSLCGQRMTTAVGIRKNYCPNCGAIMDGGVTT